MTRGELMLLPGALVVTGETLALVARLADAGQAGRRRNGLAPSRELAELAGACRSALAVCGRTAVRDEPDEQPEAVPLDVTSWVTTQQAAEKLDRSERQIRRLAQRLGGRKVGGVWYLDADALDEHLQGAA